MNLKGRTNRVIDTIRYEGEARKKTQQDARTLGIVTLVLSLISLIMSYMNYVKNQYAMLVATIILTLVLISVFVLSRLTKNGRLLDIALCVILSLILIYFTLTGGNDGFAILWTLLFLPFAMLLIGFSYGIVIGIFFEAFFIILFWSPMSGIVSAYYTPTFMLRFPMLYTAFFVLSFLAKYIIISMEIAEYKALSASKAKSEFLSRVSHELRTPLNVILSMAKLGLNDKRLEESIGRFEKIISSSSHLSDIINDVLEMSRMESGKTEIKREPLHLRAVAAECLELLELQAKGKNIDLISSVDADLPETLIGDAFRIRQILINLLSNAVKFTEKGRVSLGIAVAERSAEKCLIRFTVDDTGIGMSEDFLGKVFTPFEQEDSFLSRRYEGSGLGLAISNNLVELMGGKMKAESKLGEGSRFTYAIPFEIAETDDKEDEQVTGGKEYSLKGRRILLVDDIEINRMITCEVFTNTGADFEEACDGEEAYRKFLQSPAGYYDCIFMDIQMPKMDGYTTTGAIRACGRPDSDIPIVAMTANALKEDIDSAIAAGMSDHIAKPIDFDDCLSKAVQWCSLKPR